MIAAGAFVGNSVGRGKRHSLGSLPHLMGLKVAHDFCARGRELATLNQVLVTTLIKSPNYYKECRQC